MYDPYSALANAIIIQIICTIYDFENINAKILYEQNKKICDANNDV